MSFRRIELSVRGRQVLLSVTVGTVVTLLAATLILAVTHNHLHGRLCATMRLILDDLSAEYAELGGLNEKFRHCIDEDVEEHGPAITRIVVTSPAGVSLYSTPPLRRHSHPRRAKSVLLPDGNSVTVERDIHDIREFEVFLGLLLLGIGLFSILLVGLFSRFAGGRILKLNQLVETKDRALEELRTLTDDIAHDLRTPLTRLNMAAEAVLTGGSSTCLAENVAHDTNAMVEMINTMLEISQTDFRIDRTPREDLDLAGIIRQTADLYEAVAEDQGVKLTVNLPTTEVRYFAHKGKLQQVIGNLLDNALKFTPRGGTVDLLLKEGQEGVSLMVRDTGCGIAHADLPHIFQRFYRADSSRNLPGNGLGLALVQAIVTSYGGLVEVQSELKQGTVFTVKLPNNRQL